jgi:hypothetical protein
MTAIPIIKDSKIAEPLSLSTMIVGFLTKTLLQELHGH